MHTHKHDLVAQQPPCTARRRLNERQEASPNFTKQTNPTQRLHPPHTSTNHSPGKTEKSLCPSAPTCRRGGQQRRCWWRRHSGNHSCSCWRLPSGCWGRQTRECRTGHTPGLHARGIVHTNGGVLVCMVTRTRAHGRLDKRMCGVQSTTRIPATTRATTTTKGDREVHAWGSQVDARTQGT